MLNTKKSRLSRLLPGVSSGKSTIVLLLILVSFAGVSQAQWQTDVRLTNNPATSKTSNNNAWGIASSGNVIHVIWDDNRDGNNEIYYKRSTDGGVSWGADTRLTNFALISQSPSVSVSGSDVHILWQDFRDGDPEIYYKRSTDGGVSWGADTRLTNNSSGSWNPSVSVSFSLIHVVWHDDRDGNFEIYYKRSTDGGLSWGADTRLSNGTGTSGHPSVAVSVSDVQVSWYDERDGNYEIYYKHSTDGGVSWSADTRLTNNSAFSLSPSVTVSGSIVHVVWNDNRDGNYEIYYKRSTDGGVSWGTDSRITNNPSTSQFPSISVSGSFVHVVWNDNRDGSFQLYYKRSTNGGISWEADTRIVNNSAVTESASVTLSGSAVHVVWSDNRNVNWEIYYKRDPSGNPVGIINIGSGMPREFFVSQNYPNPFNPVTTIKYQIPNSNYVSIKLYDQLGREAAILFEGNQQAGYYRATVDGTNLASGIYYCRIIAADYSKVIKMSLIK